LTGLVLPTRSSSPWRLPAAASAADLGTIESKRRIRVLVATNEDPELFASVKSEARSPAPRSAAPQTNPHRQSAD
jgi:hypothetical protein